MKQQGEIQKATNKPKLFISNKLVDINDNGDYFNFLVQEIENLRWEEIKTDIGIEQKPIWGKQPKHAIDCLSYLLAEIYKQPKDEKTADYKQKKHNLRYYPSLGV